MKFFPLFILHSLERVVKDEEKIVVVLYGCLHYITLREEKSLNNLI